MSNLIVSKLKSLIAGVGIDFDNEPTVNGMGFRSKRNFIVNGAMAVSQEHGSAPSTVTNTRYVVDEFASVNNSLTGVMTVEQSELENSKSAKMTATSAVTDLTGTKYVQPLFNALEAQNVYHLNGKKITLSFKVETNWAGNLSVVLKNSDFTKSFVFDIVVTAGVNTVSKTIQLEADTVLVNDNTTGLSLAIGFVNEGSYQTATIGDVWQTNSAFCTTNSTMWAKTTGNFVNVTQVQLEEGSVATPFEHLKYSEYLTECQRYFEIIGRGITGCSSVNPVGFRINAVYKVDKCKTPTLEFKGPNFYVEVAGLNIYLVTGIYGVPAMGKIGCTFAVTTTAGTPSSGLAFNYISDWDAFFVNARL